MEKTAATRSIIVITGILLSGLLSVYFGKELCWDLANYHFYIPFALLNQRALIDLWPNAYIHQYLNPTLDLLSYFLITRMPPILSEFFLGALHGMNVGLIFLIAQRFNPNQTLVNVAIALLGMYGPTVLPGIGSFQNDNFICLFVLSSLLLFLSALASQPMQRRALLLSGLLLGLGIGLKLTAAIYLLGMGIATLFLPLKFKQKVQWLITWSFAVILGLLITSGYWMWHLWVHYHNPVFPFLNHLFHSSQFDATNWRDTRFLPNGILQMLFYPFYFSWDGRIADVPFQDFRFACVYVLLLLTGLHFLLNRQQPTHSLPLEKRWLIYFFIISYCVWQFYFSIARYLAPLEMLAPLVIYLLLSDLIQTPHHRHIVLAIIFMTLAITMTPTKMIRARWYEDSFFNIKLPSIVTKTANATVLTAVPAYALERDPRPQTYLIPFFPAQWQFIGIPFQQGKVHATPEWINTVKTQLDKQHPIFILTPTSTLDELTQSIKQFHLSSSHCYSITSDRQRLSNEAVWLCELNSFH